jgi:hypothetical protein
MKKHFNRTVGWILVLLGLVIFPLPIPLGLLLIVTGLALLVRDSVTVQEWIRGLRESNPGFDQQLREIRERLPDFLKAAIDATDPQRANPDNEPGPGEKPDA